MSTKLIFLLLFFLPALFCQAQLASTAAGSSNPALYTESGNFYYKNYTVKEYGASFQNWGALQDKHGVMVFANGDGVLTYDGKAWTLTETPSQSVIRSMAMDDNGEIFVGALDDFGYLKKKHNGSFVYESMLALVKPELQLMGNIWSTHVYKGFTYFESEIGMFCWNGERIRFWPWPNANTRHKSFFWNDTLYLYEEGTGLMRFEDDHFLLASSGDFFKNTRIYSALPLGKNKILFATKLDGLFIYDGHDIRPFKTQADPFLKEKQIYTGLMLPDSTVAFGTKTGGVVVIDQSGIIRAMITKENGLPTNSILSLAADQNGDLWICLDDGISRFEINNHLTTYAEKAGFEGSPNDMCRYNGKLYVASSTGLYILRPASFPFKQSFFERIPQVNASCWNLLPFENRMLIGSNEGLWELAENRLRQITEVPSYAIHRYKGDSARIVIASDNRLKSLKLMSGTWEDAGTIENIRLDNIKFNETKAGKLWLTTFSQGATLISFSQQDGSINYDKPVVKSFGQEDGLPEGFIKMNTIGREEIFRVSSKSRIFRFDYSSSRFREDTAFAVKFGLERDGLFPITNEDASGSFFFKTVLKGKNKRELILVNPTHNNSFENKRFDISRIFEKVHVSSFLEDEVIWQLGSDGIVRYEISDSPKTKKTFNTYLNKIILLGDSVFFIGIGDLEHDLTFPYSSSSFRFEFTSTDFTAEETNEFQYKLEGYDDAWSDWTTENMKEYSRLWEGKYKFVVRSRNYAEQLGTTDEFAFVVAPPWYRSIYAYMAYLAGAVFMVSGLIRWRSYKLLKEKEALQLEIAQQTREIRQQNIQLEEQSEELKINAEQLKELDKMKSNFFVNISHEFRTPLSLILSPLEKFIHEKESSQIRLTELERMHRNAKRLQQLINQLLDLAKLESGGMKVIEQQSDFIYFLRVLTASFESLAEIRNIRYEVEIPPHSYEAHFDSDKVETVLYNLLSNAFKFTPDGGRIDFRVKFPEENAQLVSISISDTGPGIPSTEVDKIFDRFYQVDSSSSREFEGSGIGLSLVKELVSLMRGQINVESELKSGTTFTVSLPLIRASVRYPAAVSDDPQKKGNTAFDGLLTQAEENKKEKAALSGSETASSESLVLLIEDNDDLRAYLKENLENDYQIVVAENGKIGLEKALELTPDLILSDMMMPVMDGFTLCTKIRQDERTSHIPFILLTARTTIESKLEGLELGADEYMTKPFNIKEIKVRMKNLLEQRRNLRKSFSREVTIQPKNISITSVDERFLNHALAIMETHLADEQFSVERFAEEIGMSRKNLLRKIKALTDQSVNEFIRNFRLNRAAQLIEGKSATVSEIAYQVGFNNLSYFSKCFKELFGILPNEYASKKSVAS